MTQLIHILLSQVAWRNLSVRVARGGYPPRAPTDPYVHALVHTVPQIMVSLHVFRHTEWTATAAGNGYRFSRRLKQSQVSDRSRLRRDSQYRQIRWTCLRNADRDELLPVIP